MLHTADTHDHIKMQPLMTTNAPLVVKYADGANNQLTTNPKDTKSLLCDPDSREFVVVRGCIIMCNTYKYLIQPQILHGSNATLTKPV